MEPRVRSGLIARPAGDELVVYDPVSHTAHCLNRTAAFVYSAADGHSSPGAIAEALAREAGSAAADDLVSTALEQLATAGLLEAQPAAPAPRHSRREAVRLTVGAAALAPIVLSLMIPSPAEAAATCIQASSCDVANFGQPCYVLSQAECASKTCTGTPGDCQ